ncbi:MAG: CBS domain-containing protein [Elusimicrobia bacterium]|nr:CBS domain-containing protein [Elusimicrobiota bacterium]
MKSKKLDAITAKNLMSTPLIEARTADTIRQLANLLLNKNISGVPVLDPLDNLVGVITKTDILRYERHRLGSRSHAKTMRPARPGDTLEHIAESDSLTETEEDLVEHWMTPHVLGVGAQASIYEIAKAMSLHQVHRLFVRDERTGKLCGVITTFDILRHLAEAPDE